MFEATVNEFPFVQEMPKREKSRVARIWDLVKHLDKVSEVEGTLLPFTLAFKALELSRTRCDQLVAEGRLKRIEVDGHVFVTLNSVVEFAEQERKAGRPLGRLDDVMDGKKTALRASIEIMTTRPAKKS